MKELPCSRCGRCCTAIPVKGLLMFGLPVRSDGKDGCAHLGDDNLCTIYASRPEICRVDKIFDRLNTQTGISWDDYAEMNSRACKTLEERCR